MNVNQIFDLKKLTENHRVFVNETRPKWWQRLLGKKPETEILIFDKGSHLDFPLQVEFLKPPDGLTSRERFEWRQRHGLSAMCSGAELMAKREAEREGS